LINKREASKKELLFYYGKPPFFLNLLTIDLERFTIHLIMYRRSKFLEVLHQIREEMSREADYDMDYFAEMVRNSEGERQREKGKNIENEEQNFSERNPNSKDRKLIYGNRF
jgi:hypothetical protein